MAILIPSKNIYNISDNNKVLDNKKSYVTVGAKKVLPNNDYSTPVICEFEYNLTTEQTVSTPATLEKDQDSASGVYAFASAYIKEHGEYFEKKLTFSKLLKNKRITKLNNENGQIVKIERYGSVTKYPITSTVLSSKKSDFKDKAQMGEIAVGGMTSQTGTIEFPNLPQEKSASYSQTTTAGTTIAVSAKVSGFFDDTDVSVTEDEDNVYLDLKMLYKYECDLMGGVNTTVSDTQGVVDMSGERSIYNTERIDITIYGNTIGIVLEDYDASFGDSKENPISYTGNELFQHSNLSEEIAQSILSEYKNGKETAIIKCSIGEYYYDDGNFALSTKRDYYDASGVSVGYQDYGNYVEFWLEEQEPLPYDVIVGYSVYENGLVDTTNTTIIPKGFISVTEPLEEGNQTMWSIDKIYTNDKIPMTFVEGDVVIPYIMGANGYEEPISAYNDGTAKSFQVVGTNIYYDGAVWQELTLQEV